MGLIFYITLYILSNMDWEQDPSFTPEMCRAGRALVGITQAELSRRSHVSRLTIAYFERGERKPIPANLAAIRSALEASRITFLPGGAVLRNVATTPSTASSQRIPAVLQILRGAALRLQQLGVKHLSLFGSTARGTERPDSDIDVLVDLDAQRSMDLFDYAGIVAEIQKLFPQRVDVARRDKLKSHVAPGALGDEIHVF
ncbi:MAG TPA: nucleotidyltransferase domain-containing protein [Candidatus Binataceae bacterium]|jgi:predicted nucleotidyltransferase|nr:nucleotidyltransferase domain-containing protein [Candidatus Binataceae bacterium]